MCSLPWIRFFIQGRAALIQGTGGDIQGRAMLFQGTAGDIQGRATFFQRLV